MGTTDVAVRSRAELMVELGRQLRVDAIRCTAAAGSGHPTSAMSAADLMAVLLAGHLHYDFSAPTYAGNDHFVLSKGHASPLLYAMLRSVDAISDDELLTYRRLGSRLEGHPTPRLPWVEVATGSLGQGLPIAAGLAWTGRRLDQLPYRVWVLCGDSELAEGSMWEAFELAGYEQLDNLVAIVDVNRLGQRGPTRHGWDTPAYARRIRAFGWNTIEIDGHDVNQIDEAYAEAAGAGQPTVVLARTHKGSGAADVDDREGQHGKPLRDPEKAIAGLGGVRHLPVEVARPPEGLRPHRFPTGVPALPTFQVGEKVATRTAFGKALAAVGGSDASVVVLDGEVADSTRTEFFAEVHPERFFECYIAEQQMIATAVAMHVRGWRPFAATFAAFLTRAYDFIRMAAIGRANLRLSGSHAGVEIGQDGPSQMGLEDLAALRVVPGSTVLYPCDANQTVQLVQAMAETDGISYLRTTRGDTPVIYGPDEQFSIGGSRVLRSTSDDQVTIVAAGITLHQALAAADRLSEQGIPTRVIDLYSVKPVDEQTLRTAARDTGRILTVEDHRPEGGLGDAVVDALTRSDTVARIRKLAVRAMPASASSSEQLAAAGIDTAAIVETARELVTTG
jgi:transketolase